MRISTCKSVPTHHSLSRQLSDHENSTVVEPMLNRLQATIDNSNTLWGVRVKVRSENATPQDGDELDECMETILEPVHEDAVVPSAMDSRLTRPMIPTPNQQDASDLRCVLSTDAIDEVMKLINSLEVDFDKPRPHERVDNAIREDWDELDDAVNASTANDVSTPSLSALISGLA